ncbi:hypothetical protein CEXT_465921 [Caerostris extrusa]|uniref:Zn(2)-C6 fungal-type domain-containing protein n=1 Tax=Caerostris extrusa TaxID=172846 RepID=A0AAV4XU94_CAEEX|nr:hypothetical protein CEXT_465921 [Caerostris extrusa]
MNPDWGKNPNRAKRRKILPTCVVCQQNPFDCAGKINHGPPPQQTGRLIYMDDIHTFNLFLPKQAGIPLER